MKRRASWGQFAHEIEKSQGSADFDIEFAMDFEIHTRARREVVLDSMTYKFSRVARDVVLDVIICHKNVISRRPIDPEGR